MIICQGLLSIVPHDTKSNNKLTMIISFLSALWTLILDNPTFNNRRQSSLINVQCAEPTFTTAYEVWIGIVAVWCRSAAAETICSKCRSMPQKDRIMRSAPGFFTVDWKVCDLNDTKKPRTKAQH